MSKYYMMTVLYIPELTMNCILSCMILLYFLWAGSVFPARSYILQMKDSVFFSHRASKALELQVSGWP